MSDKKAKPNWFIVTLGIVLVAIGIFGLVLPFLQGIITILAGIAVLSSQLPSVKRKEEKIKAWIKSKAF